MGQSFSGGGGGGSRQGQTGLRFGGKVPADASDHHRTGAIGIIGQFKLATMIFDDLGADCEAKPGTARPASTPSQAIRRGNS